MHLSLFHRPSSNRLVWLFLIIPCLVSPFANATNYLGVDLTAGVQKLNLSRQDEAEKNGQLFGGHLLFEAQSDKWGVGFLGLGATYVSQIGATDIWQQRIETVLFTVDTGYLYPIFKSLYLGVHLRSQSGEGAHYDIFELNKFQTSVFAGPRIEYRIHRPHKNLQWVLGVSALQDFTVQDRSIFQVPISIGIRCAFGGKPQVTTLPPAPVVIPEATEMVVQIDSKQIHFDRNQDVLRPEAERLLNRIAEVLVSQAENWDRLEISGHTDISGNDSRNQQLSQLRALAVTRFLMQKGVSEKKITFQGFGSSRLLPGLDPVDPRHRRVEFYFSGIKNPAPFNKIFNEALKNGEGQ